MIGYCVIIDQVADMDDNFAFTTLKDFDAEIEVIGTAERLVRITDYADISFIYRISLLND